MNKGISNITNDFDVVVVGGGIIGATIFRELCLSNLNVLLVEKEDFCCDISSGSTEMAHGGFRYLLTLKDWNLVIESLVERELLHTSAPHLVRRLNFYMPLYAGDEMYFNPSFMSFDLSDIGWKIGKYGGFGTKLVGAGMRMYKLFALYGIKSRHLDTEPAEVGYEKMKPGELLDLGFNINPKGLATCYKYTDSKIEDVERLVIENVLSGLEYSKENGTTCTAVNQMELICITGEKEIILRDHAHQKEFKIIPKIIVNATGAGINNINKQVDREASGDIHLVAGSHLLTPRTLWENDDPNAAVGWWTNKKIMFSISKGTDRLLMGTHERYVSQDEIENRNLNHKADIKGIIENVRRVFPNFEFDMEKHPYYTRVRPLKPEQKHLHGGSDPTHFSRRDYVRELGNVISVTGKLGPSRSLAEMTTKNVFKLLGRECPQSKTGASKLYGGNVGESLQHFIDNATATNRNIDKEILSNTIKRYGSRYSDVLNDSSSSGMTKIDPDCLDSQPLCALLYSFRVEGARNMIQAFRRTGTYRYLGQGLNCIVNAAQYVGENLGWDSDRINKEVEDYKKYIQKTKSFK